ncbi:Transcriptional regulator of nonfermentable carbon utilization [Haplosporangium bisporale]|nr:Transcriptional regulator of nonfermentable carbon utilization [Haplosporangium bisporale]
MLQHNPRPLGAHDQNQVSSQRRKKASRACFHCQKAHLTCDDSRPCQRCVKRDLAGTCADGVRKKAKYLQEAMDSQQQAAEEHHHHHDEMAQTTMEDPSSLGDASLFFVPSTLSTAPTTASALTNEYGFGSEAVNLEYSILSTMLSSSSPPPSSLSSSSSASHQLSAMTDLSMIENWQRQSAIEAMANSLSQRGHNHQLQRALLNQHHQQQQQQQQQQQLQQQQGNNDSHSSVLGSGRSNKRKFPSNTPENVYANTKQPFNYTEGFHYLLRYVREKMDKEEMMRICRAMAMFRPSFIALIMNLTPEDLIFMETCFQRTVLEFEKLISFSGTPTVVWRRTGEIALVGKEFSLLTQWSREQLVPSQGSGKKKTYIYELMDNQSAVEYWEKFSTHAFENTEQTVMTTCILLSPTQRVVPCTFCFTIKRDIFDIPLAIVGNFLPILS